MAVGISDYADENLGDLPFAREDAAAFAAMWERRGDYYSKVEVKYLADGDHAEIMESLAWLQQVAKPKDSIMMFFAGHSLQHKDSGKDRYHFLPADAGPASNMLSAAAFMEAFAGLQGNVLLFMDTAHAIAGSSEKLAAADMDSFANELSSPENSVIVFSASTGAQSSYTGEKHGVFIAALQEALAGKADQNQDGKLKLLELEEYVSSRVSELTGGKQTPILTIPEITPDFVILDIEQKMNGTAQDSVKSISDGKQRKLPD
ncbi:MAG: caspase family protein [Gammaproteobacteria bacterium]|nr:caspase family protein [Gammaproteobacteria bacterium]